MPELRFPDPALNDGVVALRPWRQLDTAQRATGFLDQECLKFSWPGTEPPTEADTVAAAEHDEILRQAGIALSLAVVDPDRDDQVWGSASLYDVDVDQARAAVGFWLVPAARGHGVATRTLRLLCGWAFDQLRLARIELTCAPDNERSQRVAQRCGFVREGVLRSHLRFQGGRRDTMVFSLLPGELR